MKTARLLACTGLALLLAACSPKYNWRDYASPDAPYHATFPDKPATYKRSVNLDGMDVEMTMTAAEVDGAMFAVGTGVAPDAAHAQAAVAAMRTAMVRNIGATVTAEKSRPGPVIDIEAAGSHNGQPMRLVGHFEARGQRFYQVVALGPQRSLPPEQVAQFMDSFKLQ